MTQHKIDIDFENSANRDQYEEVIYYNTTKGNCMIFIIWPQKNISSGQKQWTKWKDQQVLTEKYYHFQQRKTLEMRKQESTEGTKQPSCPQSMQSSHTYTCIISQHQNQLHYQSYMARIQQKKTLPSHHLPVYSIEQTQKAQDCAYFLQQIRRQKLNLFLVIDCMVSPSVGQISIEETEEAADCEMIVEGYFLIAFLSSKMFMFRLRESINKVVIKQLVEASHLFFIFAIKQIQSLINTTTPNKFISTNRPLRSLFDSMSVYVIQIKIIC